MSREEIMNNVEMMKQEEMEKAVQNRREDKKAFKQVVIGALAGGVVGGLFGFLSVGTKDSIAQLAEKMLDVIGVFTPYANYVLASVVWFVVAMWMHRGRNMLASWDGEDEDLIEKVEHKISLGLSLTSVNMILAFFFAGLGVHAADMFDGDRKRSVLILAVSVIGFVYSLVVTIHLQKNLVNMTKEINPEKQGSVYDMKFQKTWMESCDESERLSIYKASHAAYKTTNSVCMVLLLICVLGLMTWDIGVLPLTMVTIIWLAHTISYELECFRLAKH